MPPPSSCEPTSSNCCLNCLVRFSSASICFFRSAICWSEKEAPRARVFHTRRKSCFAAINWSLAIRTTKFHKSKFSSTASDCNGCFPAHGPVPAPAHPPRRARAVWQIQHPLDHFGDGGFLRRAITDDGLFHLARSDFKNFRPASAMAAMAAPRASPMMMAVCRFCA